MSQQMLLEEIERVRQSMYEAYHNGATYEEIVEISTCLDRLLNQLQ